MWAAEQCLCHATPKLSRMLSSLHTRSLQAGIKLGHSLLRLQPHRLQGRQLLGWKLGAQHFTSQHTSMRAAVPAWRRLQAGGQFTGILLRLQRDGLQRRQLLRPESPAQQRQRARSQRLSMQPGLSARGALQAGDQLRGLLLQLRRHRLQGGHVLSPADCLQSLGEQLQDCISLLTPLPAWQRLQAGGQLRRLLLRLRGHGFCRAGLQPTSGVSDLITPFPPR